MKSARHSCRIFMKIRFSRQIFFGKKIYSDIKFHENPSSGSRVVSHGRRDMTKPTVAFRNFANAPPKKLTYVLLLRVVSIFSGHVGCSWTILGLCEYWIIQKLSKDGQQRISFFLGGGGGGYCCCCEQTGKKGGVNIIRLIIGGGKF